MLQLLHELNQLLAILFFFCYAYQFVYSLVALCPSVPLPEGKVHRFAVLVAARNEAGVIARLIDSIHQQAWQVSGHLICGLQRLGAQLAPCALSDRTRSTIVSFQAPELERTYRFLRENRIACSMRCGYIRMGIHGYNTVEEAEQVLAALKGFWGR